MLDLSVFREQYFDLKLLDGEVLKLKKPTQRMVIEMMGYELIFKDTKNHKNIEMMVDTFSQMILDILNNNANEKVFTKEFVEENFDFALGMTLVQAYMGFVQELNSNPNL